MSVYKIKGSWWVDIGHLGTRVRKRSPENGRTGAMAFEAKLRGQIGRGEKIEKPKVPTFAEFAIGQWFKTYVEVNNKPSEQRSKKATLKNHLIPFFGKQRLNTITRLSTESYKAKKLSEQYSAKTINNHLAILSSCLRTAVDWEIITDHLRVKFLKVPPRTMDYLSFEEAMHLISSTQNQFWKTMILLAFKTGMRMGELMGLSWEDIDFVNGTMTVQRSVVLGNVSSPKSNKIRILPLTHDVLDALLNLKSKNQGYVFTRSEGQPLHQRSMRDALHRACKKAGLRLIGWHTLRHSFASCLVSNGASLKAVQDLLGHQEIKTTMIYSHLYPSELKKAIQLLEPEVLQAKSRQYNDNQRQNEPQNHHS